MRCQHVSTFWTIFVKGGQRQNPPPADTPPPAFWCCPPPPPAAGFGQPTLTRVQVGLLSIARDLKGDLDSIAARADTGSSQGLHRLLQGGCRHC
jgi:hypothetical protein